jgi:hypothetical protein
MYQRLGAGARDVWKPGREVLIESRTRMFGIHRDCALRRFHIHSRAPASGAYRCDGEKKQGQLLEGPVLYSSFRIR